MRITITVIVLLFNSLFATAQVNDNCANATRLNNLNNFCSAGSAYTTVGATDDGYAPAACWNTTGTINDVWFSFTAIAYDVNISITGNLNGLGTLIRPQIALYSGACGGIINELGCTTAPAGTNSISLYKGGLIIGQSYLIRVDGVNSNTGTFSLCINNFTPQPNAQGDCLTAGKLCNKNTITNPQVNGPGNDPTEGIGTCLDNGLGNPESNSVWYQWTCKTTGTLTFHITPLTPGDDIDFAMYELTPNCANKNLIRCNGASCLGAGNLGVTGLDPSGINAIENFNCGGAGNGNSPFCSVATITAGTTYVLLINNFTSSNNGFTLSFGGTSEFLGPEASFTYTPTSGCIVPGTQINFTNTSTGASTNKWTFGANANPSTFTGVTPPPVTYNVPGTYTATLEIQSAQGCIVVYSQTVNIAQPPAAPVVSPVTYCEGDNASPLTAVGIGLLWYNASTGGVGNVTAPTPATSPSGITTYYVSQTVGGCESPRAVLTVNINAKPVLNIPPAIVCSGQPATLIATPDIPGGTYFWNTGGATQSITVNPSVNTTYQCTYTVNGCSTTSSVQVTIGAAPTVSVAPQTICNGQTASLNATPSVIGGNYLWTPGGFATQTISVNPNSSTAYKVVYDYFGCKDSTTALVTVNPVPNITVANQIICDGQTATLTANTSISGGLFAWNPGGASSSTINVTPNNTTVYTCIYSLSGCIDTTTATVQVNPVPNITVSPETICPQQPATLTATPDLPGGGYLWTPGGSTASTITVSPNTNTTYSCRYMLNGCRDSTTALVSVYPPPNILVSPSTSICEGDNITLTTGGANTYTWNPGNLIGPSITVNPGNTTNYIVTGTDNNNCSGINNVTVTVFVKPDADAGPDLNICTGSTAQLQPRKLNGQWQYSWTPATDLNNDTISNPVFSGKTTNTYYLTITVPNSVCNSSSDTIVVNVNPRPNVDAGSDTTIMAGNEVQLTAYSTDNITWSPFNTLSCTNCYAPVALPLSTTSYIVSSINIYGCRNSDTVTVFVDELITLFVPNAFTPESPVGNKLFSAFGTGVHDFQFYIFNRWGETVFHTNDINETWDGTADGSNVQDDVYVYLAKARSITGKSITRTGPVTVIR